MLFLYGFIAGVICTGVAAFFVVRNNRKELDDVIAQYNEMTARFRNRS